MLEPASREKVLNVISLEISDTPLAQIISPPRVVRELDWVENFWPSAKRGKGQSYPKVQLYCLMGVASAWTVRNHVLDCQALNDSPAQDWHIDFAGSSVYYHILHGSKVIANGIANLSLTPLNQVFYFIRPTPSNLAAYEKWSGTELQNNTWLGDMVDEVVKVELTEGNTMIIPTGWIHAVVIFSTFFGSSTYIILSTPQ
jgi:F-box/leucine-rich repeat protein 10/11